MPNKVSDHNHLRVCHINLASGFRGGERQTELLIRELAGRGWRQRLVVRAGAPLADRCRDVDGLEIAPVVPNPLTAAIAARNTSLVHAHEARAVYSGWFLRRLQGIPYLLTRRIDHALHDTFARTRAYRAADCVVAISTSIANTVQSHHPEIHCHVVPSAHADMAENRSRSAGVCGKPDGKTVVGHIGELDHSHKGQGSIIEAARTLQATRPELHFMLVGEGRDEGRFRREAAGLSNIEFVGFVDNVEDYLATFDVFLYPSLREGLGSSLLDAMCFGLPIVASDVGGIPEIVEHNVNGLLVRPGSAEDIVVALERLVTDAHLRAKMSRENLEKALQYSAARMASSYEAIYERILGLKPLPRAAWRKIDGKDAGPLFVNKQTSVIAPEDRF